MDRLFGNKKKEEKKVEPTPIKPEEPLIDLTEQSKKMEDKCEALYKQIDQLDKEIKENYDKSKKLKGGQAQSCKQRCVNLLQRKKMLEQQVQTYSNSTMTLNQVAFTKENIDNTLETAKAMKQAVAQQKVLQLQLDFDELDQVRDDLEDMMWESKNFNEQMNRNFEVNVNEDDLDAEFEDLEEQFAQEQQCNYQQNKNQNQNIQAPQYNLN